MSHLQSILRAVAGVPALQHHNSSKPDRPDSIEPSLSAQTAPPRKCLAGWNDEDGLLCFGEPENNITIRHSLSGVLVLGENGSGKTSGSGAALARSYLRAGYGALVLCVKPDEAALWQRYAAEAGRSDDVILFGSDPKWVFNFLDYEAHRPGVGSGLTENLIQLFTEIASIGNGEAGGGKGDDPFWDRAMRSIIRNMVDVLLLARQPLTLPLMFDVLRSAPLDLERTTSKTWADGSFCAQMLMLAEKSTKETTAAADYEQVHAFWMHTFPAMPDKTRGSVIELFRTMAESLMRGKMRTLFCEGKSTVIPEHSLAGKILIIDLPVKVWGEVGRYAGVLWKYCFQKAIERRPDNADGRARPVTLWVDECQYFSTRYDYLFQTTARSSRVATVYLSQNMSGLIASLGGENNGRARVQSLLGNLTTKIFHANSDTESNQWAAEIIGKTRLHFRSVNNNYSFGQGGASTSLGSSTNEQMDYRLQPTVFTQLRKGGNENGRIVQGIVFQTGREWRGSDGVSRNWLLANFAQR